MLRGELTIEESMCKLSGDGTHAAEAVLRRAKSKVKKASGAAAVRSSLSLWFCSAWFAKALKGHTSSELVSFRRNHEAVVLLACPLQRIVGSQFAVCCLPFACVHCAERRVGTCVNTRFGIRGCQNVVWACFQAYVKTCALTYAWALCTVIGMDSQVLVAVITIWAIII